MYQSIQALTSQLLPDTHARILILGDVVSKAGRDAMVEYLPIIRECVKPLDLVCINAENLAGGYGISKKIFLELKDLGVQVFTMGNHWNDHPDVHKIKDSYKELVLPHNLQDTRPTEFEIERVHLKVEFINLLGQFAMKEQHGNPFVYLAKRKDTLLSRKQYGNYACLVDVHAEANSEKQAIYWYLNGIASGVYGTHTHVPTADLRISPQGTALLCDVGMTGDYNTVIGQEIEKAMLRFFPTEEKKRIAQNNLGQNWLCGLLLEILPATGQTQAAHQILFRGSNEACVFSTSKQTTL